MSQPVADRSPSTGRGGASPGRRARRGASVLGAAILVASSLLVPASVGAANANPVAHVDQVYGDEDTVLTGNVLTNDTDADGGTLAVYSFTPTTNGTLQLTPAGVLSYTPPPNFSGTETTTYTLQDGQGGFALGYISLHVAAVNDLPVAADDAVDATEDTAAAVAASVLLANDTDADGDTLVVAGVAAPSGGSVDLAAGTVTFTPTPEWCGVGGFSYEVSDGHGGTDVASVAVSVACVNDPPVAVADAALVPQNAPPTVIDVTANDTDADGDALTVTAASVAPAAGTVAVASASSVRFTPADLFEGDATVSYTISDGHGATADGTLVVSVVKDEVAPAVAVPAIALGGGRVNERGPLTIRWSATDAGVGVATYEVQVRVNGGAWSTVYTGAGTSLARSYPFGSTVAVQVRATDRLGNRSGWAASATRSVVAYQAPGSRKITYSTRWSTVRTKAASGVGYRYTTTKGKAARLQFTGREVLYVAPRSSASGYVRVYVDGAFAGRYNLRSSTSAAGQIIFRRSWATAGTHTIRIVNDQGGRRTSLDAFVVLR
jgi:hypothetical protein